jgi:hypothetical protein
LSTIEGGGKGPLPAPSVRGDSDHPRLSIAITATIAITILILTLTPSTIQLIDAPFADKAYHLLSFTALTSPAFALSPRASRPTMALAIALGILIETIQPYVGRDASFFDAAADVVGCIIGMMIGRRLRRRISQEATSATAANP